MLAVICHKLYYKLPFYHNYFVSNLWQPSLVVINLSVEKTIVCVNKHFIKRNISVIYLYNVILQLQFNEQLIFLS